MIPWLAPLWDQLLQAFARNKMPHAILLVGNAGLGKEELANSLVYLMLCQSPTATGACQCCRSCHLLSFHSHPDYRDLGREEGIGIDQIRDITAFLAQTAHGQRKVVVLQRVDALGPSAGNALLKTLEEPPGESLLILMAERSAGVLPTIKSRCSMLNAPMPPWEMAIQWLQADQPHSPLPEIQECLSLAGGAPLKAKALLLDATLKEAQETFRLAMFSADELHLNRVQQLIASQPQEALYFLYYWVAEFIRYSLQCSSGFIFKPTEEKKWLAKARSFTPQQSFLFLEKVYEAMRACSLPSTNKSLMVDALFYQWHYGLMEK